MSVYDIVTDKILSLLEEGTVPWRKPWKSSGGPRNLLSNREYRGINSFLLNCSPYSSPYWLTYRQATQKGGHVRKGEKSMLVVFWKFIEQKEKDDDSASPGSPQGKVPLLRYYRVFNLDQVEGIDPPADEQPINPFTPIEQAEQIIENMECKPTIQYGGDRAAYSPSLDLIKLPERTAFSSPEEFYSTAFHELAHATGHASRLARKGVTEPSYFGSHSYSQEELVAEFGASMVCGVCGIEQQTIENSASYISGWLKVLKGDKRLAVIAAGQAQKAADLILNRDTKDESKISRGEEALHCSD